MAGTAAANKGIRRLQRQLAARDGRIAQLSKDIAWAIGYLKRFQLMARTIGDEATANGVGIVVENLEKLRVR